MISREQAAAIAVLAAENNKPTYYEPGFIPHGWVIDAVQQAYEAAGASATAQDPIVEANRQMLLERSNVGIQKYGKMLNRADYNLRDWLQHALEETLDQANYLQASIRFLDENPQAIIRSQQNDGVVIGFAQLDESDFEINAVTGSVNGQLQDYSIMKTSDDTVVTFDDYQRLAMRTAPEGEALLDGLNHAALGFLTEIGEVMAAGEDHKHAGEEIGDTAWYVALATAHLDMPLGALMGTNEIDALDYAPGMLAAAPVFAGRYATEVKRAKIYGKPLTDDMKAMMLASLKLLMVGLNEACGYRGLDLGDVLQENIDKLRKRFPDKFSGAAAEARADKGGVDARSS